MKRVIILLTLIALFVPLINAACNIEVSMINQDPYPAIPGDYVKVVFQIDGIENTECGTVEFGLKEDYPISLDPEIQNPIDIDSGTFQRGYSSFYLAPYKLRIDKDALDGDNPIEIYYQYKNSAKILQEFEIYVEDTRADFEVHIKDYNPSTKEITFEILNIEKVDVEALTIEIPKQDNLEIKGPNIKVIGDLDSNEYTSAEFEGTAKTGEINLTLIYTDSINVRREVNKTIMFDSSYFTDRNNGGSKIPWFWIIVGVGVIAWLVYRRHKKKKKEAERKKRLSEHVHHKH